MKIIYFANHGNTGSDDTEGHISYSLRKLGHEVVEVNESKPHIPAGDLFLFHKGGGYIHQILPKLKMPKVFWYFDKVWHDRPAWFEKTLPMVDFGFLTDETWLKGHLSPKLAVLRQGIGDRDISPGKPDLARFGGKVAFTGQIYSGREQFSKTLRQSFFDDYRIYNNIFNRDLFDLCASVPIIIAPPYPSDDHYWSSRIYMVLGSGGFLVHPKLAGLAEEYQDGVHYAGYSDEFEMIEKIRHFLAYPKEREKIREAGYQKTINEFTYTQRCKSLLAILAQKNIGITA